VHDALPLLRRAREVVVISVTDDKEIRVLNSGTDLCRYLNRWDINARFETATRGSVAIGVALLDHAHRIKADLLVMGGFGHPLERQIMFGSATQDILRSALKLPVLLSH
jgi:nucleotide-binding universal stress UspA family protein